MIVLKDINALRASCSVAPSTPLSVVYTYSDTGVINADKGVTTRATTLSNSIVEIIGSPVSRINRDIRQVSFLNTDNQTQTVTVYFSQSGADYKIYIAELFPNEKLEFTQDDGWETYDADGVKKNSSLNGDSYLVTRGATSLQTNNNTSLYPLIAIRLNASFLTSKVRAIKGSITCTSTCDFHWYWILNLTIVGVALSFSALTGTSIDQDVSRINTTTLTGGTIIDGGVGAQSTTESEKFLIEDYELQSGDILVLAVQRLTGAAETFYSAITILDKNG